MTLFEFVAAAGRAVMLRDLLKRATGPDRRRHRLSFERLEARRLLSADGVVVFNEVMYHAADDSELEWVELHNQMAVNVDISGWRLDGAVDYQFAEGTVITGGGYLVVAASPELLQAEMGFADALGPYGGRLDNDGETIELRNKTDRLMDEFRYNDNEPWPIGPDGFGPSLSKIDRDTASEPAENWAASRREGGTPGEINFPEKISPIGTKKIVTIDSEWKHETSRTDLGTAWRESEFDDDAWDSVTPRDSSMLITEVGIGSPDYVEIQNVSGGPVDTTGWFVVANDAHDVNLWHEEVWELPSEPVAAGEVLYRNDAGKTAEHFGGGIYWPSMGSGWVMIVDDGGQVVDFVAWGYDQQQIREISLDIGPLQNLTIDYAWIGKPVAHAQFGDLSMQRTGDTDYNEASDWALLPSASPGVGNDGLVLPVSTGIGIELPSLETTHYLRNEFESTYPANQTELKLNLAVDDGAVLYLNGEEIYRQNLPAGPIDRDTPAATDVGMASLAGGIDLPVESLVQDTNVLAMEVHQAAGDRADAYLAAEVTRTLWPSEWQMQNTRLALNEVSAAGPHPLQLELVNHGTRPLDLGGYVIATSGGGEYVLPAETLPPGDYRSLDTAELGFNASPGEALLVYSPDRGTVIDAVRLDTTHRGRYPDGSGQWLYPDLATFGEPNHFAVHDEIVINEIMYHHRPQNDGVFAEIGEEWIELYNRSGTAVDLGGWRLDDAISYVFPPETVLGAGEYLVVSNDAAALAEKYPAIRSFGDFDGSLNNRDERILLVDAAGNPADEVHYYQDGRWPKEADGGGASLELRDPDADNASSTAWSASNEATKSSWAHYSYEGVASASSVGPDGQWNEFVMGLLNDGVVLLDNLSVIRDPNGTATEMIANGSFDSDTPGGSAAGWRNIGNHRHSEVIVDPDNEANQVLRFVSTGQTEHMHNHGETTLKQSIQNGITYRISFDAKWISGSNQLNTRLYFNRLPKTTFIAQPSLHGTPGLPNSTRVANAGPTYEDLSHSPAVPLPSEPVIVSVDADDPDGVAKMTLYYSVESSPWMSVPMTVDGDGYSGTIPEQAAGDIVQFYVEGEDAFAETSTFPQEGEASRALYQVEDNLAATNGLHNLRIILTPNDAAYLHNTINLMSNDRVGATVIYDETDVFYDVGVRLSGSERARPRTPRLAFAVRFNSEELFRGSNQSIILDRSQSTGFGQQEILTHHVSGHAGVVPAEYNDLIHIITPQRAHTGSAELQLARYTDVFLESQFDNGADGNLFEYELVYFPTTADAQGNKRPEPDGVRGVNLMNLGNDREDYRHMLLIRSNRSADDYSQAIEWAKVMGLSGTTFNERIGDMIDVDQWLRAFAWATTSGAGDNYNIGSQHNAQFYVRPEDNRVLYFPHDLDAFLNTTRPAVANSTLSKLITVPERKHMYYGHLHDILSTTYNQQYMQQWTTHYGSLLPGQNFGSHLSFINTRSNYLLGQVNAAVKPIDFDITTNGGDALTVDDDFVTLEGTGWVNVRELRLAGQDIPLTTTWPQTTGWRVQVPLVPGENPLTIEAYDFQGELVDSESITVTSTLTERPVQEFLRIAEINYHPHDADTAAGELDVDDNEFEFVELLNTSTSETLDLTGVRLVQANVGGDNQGIRFDFASQSLGPGERVVVVGNRAAFESRYGDAIPIAEGNDAGGVDGEFGGRLANGGEMLTLLDASGAIVQQFAYNDGMPWPSRADGSGSSLVVRNASGDFSDPGNWYASVERGGSPGTVGADPVAHIVARHIFYNNSAFDGNDPDANAADDAAIAPDKEALLPGAAATFANYTSYDRGINGIIVDIADPTGTPELADFAFLVGNSTDPQQWVAAPTPTELTVRPGEGTDNSARVTIIWPDNAIRGQWLQVAVQPTANTGLSEPDVFYFGNAPAEAGDNPTNTIVNATDEIAARNFPHSVVDQSLIDDLYDYNRDRLVDATDQVIARANQTNPRTMLRMLRLPAIDDAIREPVGSLSKESLRSTAAVDWQQEYESTQAKREKTKDVERVVDLLLAVDWA